MANWTDNDLRALDLKFALGGVHRHQRPLRAAIELLGSRFEMGAFGNPEVKQICDDYERLFPEGRSAWPGAGIGIATSVDQVRKITLSVTYGSMRLEPWQDMDFPSREAWWDWCRQSPDIGAETSFAWADVRDITAGTDFFNSAPDDAQEMAQMANSNLEDIANALPTSFRVDSIIQPICLLSELSLKAALRANGAPVKEIRVNQGHDLNHLAERLVERSPHRDDPLMMNVISRMPAYVQSRYKPAGLTRLEVVRLALGSQMVAASAIRRVSGADLAAQLETGGWPAPRKPIFD